MFGFLMYRLSQSVATVVAVVLSVFFLSRLAGDPSKLFLPVDATPQAREIFRHSNGLDLSLGGQLLVFIHNLVRGNLGTSIWRAAPVSQVIFDRLPATLLLGALVLVLALPVSLILGTIAGIHPEGLVARVVSALSAATAALADFWVGLLLIWAVAFGVGWLPSGGGPSLRAAILPTVTLALHPIGVLSQVVRASVERETLRGHVRAARARGLSPARVVARYVVRNALIPVLATLGNMAIHLFNGVVVVETVFGWPGIGGLTINAVDNLDFPLLQGIVIVVAGITFVVNLLVDVGVAVLDPRIRRATAFQ
jgi:peptide/nickel transport system permease protein